MGWGLVDRFPDGDISPIGGLDLRLYVLLGMRDHAMPVRLAYAIDVSFLFLVFLLC